MRARQQRGVSSAKNEYETSSNHPVLKTGWVLHAHIPRFLLARPDRKQKLCDQRFHFGRRNKAKQELPCKVSGESGVNAVEIFTLRLRKRGMQTKQGGKIIERHSGKDLLLDK